MDAFAGYGSESSDERESAPAPTFKPAWQNDSEDDDSDHEGSSKEKTAVAKEDNDAAATAVSTGPAVASEPPIKKKKLPSALDALNKATTTFLDASKAQPEPEEEEIRLQQAEHGRNSGGVQMKTIQQTAEEKPCVPPVATLSQAAKRAEDAKIKNQKDKERSFKAKEKRKRDIGQQAKDKNYVEEEKRILREHGGGW